MPYPSRAPVYWSAPSIGQQYDPATEAARFHFSRSHAPYGRLSGSGQDQVAQATQQALQAVGEYMRQRQNDRIANQLLAAQQQGRQVTADELSAASKPFGGDIPDLGGQQALAAIRQQQADQAESTKEFYDQAYKQAQIQHLNRLGFGDDGTGTGRGGVPRYQLPDGTWVTGNKYADLTRPHPDKARGAFEQNLMKNYGVGVDDLAAIDTTTPNVVRYTDLAGKPVDNATAMANPNQYVAQAQTPSGLARIPLAQFPSLVNTAKNLSARSRMVGTPRASGQNTNQPDINQAAQAMQQPDLPAPDYSNNIPTGAPVTDAFSKARAAIAAGADPTAVKKRLQDAGYDTTNL